MAETEQKPSILDLVINQDPQGVQAAFADKITDTIGDKVNDRTIELAKEMFSLDNATPKEDANNEPAEVEPAEVDNDDEIEGDELSDEEWNELISQLEDEDEAQEGSEEVPSKEETDDDQDV